jgi:HD-like signal output (HDOD) protein
LLKKKSVPADKQVIICQCATRQKLGQHARALQKEVEYLVMSLLASLEHSAEHNTRSAIRLMIQRCENLPTVPWATAPIITLASNINVSIDQLEAAVEADPSCTARLLQKANAAYYSSERAGLSIRRAILLFGYGVVENIALNLPVFDSFHQHNSTEMARLNGLWLHSRAVAVLARRIAYDVRQAVESDVAFCAGLLHDLGRIILLHLFPEVYHQLLAQLENDPGFDLTKAEQEVFHLTHAEAGRWLAETWMLPAPIVRVLAFHHHSQLTDPLITTVMLADHLVKRQRLGLAGSMEPFATPERLARALRLTSDQVQQYTAFLAERAEDLQGTMLSNA